MDEKRGQSRGNVIFYNLLNIVTAQNQLPAGDVTRKDKYNFLVMEPFAYWSVA